MIVNTLTYVNQNTHFIGEYTIIRTAQNSVSI